MYGLTVNRTMNLSGHPSIINKIISKCASGSPDGGVDSAVAFLSEGPRFEPRLRQL